VKRRIDLSEDESELEEIREVRQKYLVSFVLFALVLLSSLSVVFYYIRQMPSNGWQSKGDKSVKRSPRQGRRKCARPFTAPRSVSKDKGKIVESEVQVITETENARDIEGRQDEEPQVISFDKGLTMLSEIEADEYAEHGEVLRWSPNSEAEEQTKDKTPDNI
jgi:hypothetical protein